MASFSPLSSNIYFPALDLIADTLGTDNSTFAISVSIYMYVQRNLPTYRFEYGLERLNLNRDSRIAQGLAPSLWGPLADAFGRRQVLIYTMLLYVAACCGIALSNRFPVLMLFRFLQAAGSSSTISIGQQIYNFRSLLFEHTVSDILQYDRYWSHSRYRSRCREGWIYRHVLWRFVP